MPAFDDRFRGQGVDPFVESYEAAQDRDGHADLADHLPDPTDPLHLAVLCELVRVDMEYAWMRGRPKPLEHYRAAFPALFDDPERARLVAFEERRLRCQAERDSPSGNDEAGRSAFPAGSDVGSFAETDLEPLARLYLRQDRCDPERLDKTLALYDGPREHTALFRDLHSTDPESVDRLAEALGEFPWSESDFAGFRIVRELGRGAFGRVYLARQGDLANRHVALKVSADPVGESQALAQLQHTNVVPIYSVHRVGALRAVCMPYFGATTLADLLRVLRARNAVPDSGAVLVDSLLDSGFGRTSAAPKPDAPEPLALQTLRGLDYVQAVLWIGARLADGLAHAHERGIIHRDLKPANVLLTDEGQPMLLDFNLAADTKLGAAAMALVGGTLPYMSPEALHTLRGGLRTADVRGDLYALGVLLFELLAGRLPFPNRRGMVDQVLPQLIEDRQGPPSRLRPANPAVSPATESIIRHCLEPEPAHRYQDARQLLEDLQRQLDHRSLRYAPDPSIRERSRKFARRHPRLGAAGAIGLLAVLVIAGLTVTFQERQRRFGPIAAERAFRQLADDHETAFALLLDPTLRDEGAAACRRALERYGILESSQWAESPLVRDLPAKDRAVLRTRLGEILLLHARFLTQQAEGAVPGRREELIRSALQANTRAWTCYDPTAIPRALRTQRADLAQRSGDVAGAEQARREAEDTPIRSPRDYALLAIDGPAESGSISDSAWAQAGRENPQDFHLWICLGQYHAIQGRLAEAEDCFTVAVALRPRSPWPYVHRGRVEIEARDYEQARWDLDQVIRLRPDLAEAYVNRALARMGQGDHPGAVEDLTTALERGTVATRVHFIRAIARERTGDRDGAARDRAEGLRKTPVDPESWVARGLAKLPRDPQGALADFEAALRLDPRSRTALRNTALVLSEHLDRTEEAIVALDRVVAGYPGDVPARVGRGVLLARLNRREAAHRDAEESLRRDSSGDTLYRVACIYALTSQINASDRPRALRMLAQALGRGAPWIEIARTDPDLVSLRTHPDFRDLLRTFDEGSGSLTVDPPFSSHSALGRGKMLQGSSAGEMSSRSSSAGGK